MIPIRINQAWVGRLLGVFVLALAAAAFEAMEKPPLAADFNQVIHNPRAFHNKLVTVIALADVEGDRFYLYHPPKPGPQEFGREIFVAMSVEGPRYDRFNDQWVEVTGVIDANRHGVAFDPCVLFVERVRPARQIPKY